MQAVRSRPLIVVASAAGRAADEIAARLRADGAVVYPAHSAGGCLRVATSIGPDLVLLDPALPKRLEGLLHAHPVSAHARVMRLDAGVLSRLAPPSTPAARPTDGTLAAA